MNSRGMIAGMMLLIGWLFVWRAGDGSRQSQNGSQLRERAP